MGKIIDLSAVMEKEEKLEQIADYMGELKDEFAALIQEFDLYLIHISEPTIP